MGITENGDSDDRFFNKLNNKKRNSNIDRHGSNACQRGFLLFFSVILSNIKFVCAHIS